MKHFKFYSTSELQSLINIRQFEIKLGERLKYLSSAQNWREALKIQAQNT